MGFSILYREKEGNANRVLPSVCSQVSASAPA